VAAASAEVNWAKYFYSIRTVCPWSYSAWQRGLISIEVWRNRVIDLDPYQARVYVVKNLNPRRLKKLCKKLDQDPCYEWLWSHPRYGVDSTAIPVLIQQSRQQLNDIRQRLRSNS
jgi:hypothetical protein